MSSQGAVFRSLFVLGLTLVPFPTRADDLSASNWSAKVDPPASPPPRPASTDYAIPFPTNLGGGGEVLYPSTASSFVAIGKNLFPNDVRQVWDLSTKKMVGGFKGQIGLDDRSLALSPDGAYLAGMARARKVIEIRASKTGRAVQTFLNEMPFIDYLDFAANDRLVFGRVADKTLVVGDLKTGSKVYDLDLVERAEPETVAISPGRNYLAVASSTDASLRIYGLAEGQLVGKAPTPKKGLHVYRCQGLAYSPDGSELAGIFDGLTEFHLVCWSVSDGKMLNDFNLGKEVPRPFLYKDQAIVWLPDGSSLLVFGNAIIDRASGKKIWSLPFDNDNLKASARRFLDNDHALIITHKPSMALRTAVVPRDKIAGAARLVKEGGNIADASLPPLIKGDTTGAKRIDVRGQPPSWSVVPKARTSPDLRLTDRPILLKSKPDDYQALLFAGAGSSQVAVVGTAQQLGQPGASDGQPRWVERFDLATGKALGRVDFPSVSDPIALSPDNSSFILRDSKLKDRLDLVAADGKQITGWRPYEKDSPGDKAVAWAAFLDPNRVLTVSDRGTLILWSLPKCKAVYVVENAFNGSSALSPDRSIVAGFDGRGLRVIDAETGAWKGEGASPTGLGPQAELKSLAFRPDGQALVALFKPSTVAVWNLKTGKVTVHNSLVMPSQGNSIFLADEDHVLLDHSSIINLNTKQVVWRFLLGSFIHPSAAIGPDGRTWAILRGTIGQLTARLGSFAPIDPQCEKAEAILADRNAPCVLRPGSSVSLQLDVNGPPQDPQGFRQAVTDAIAAKLKYQGMSLNAQAGQNSPRIILNIKDKDVGRNLEYRRMGDVRGPLQVVKLVDLICEFSMVDAQGATVWSTSRTFTMAPFGIVLNLPKGESNPEVYLKKLQWADVKNWATATGFPYLIARDGNRLLQLPGMTDLGR
jgi:WD40 repeat protein